MTSNRPGQPGEHRDAFDAAFKSLRAYRDKPDDERLWDTYLTDLDGYLWLLQRDHLNAVADARASGPQALPASQRTERD